MRRRPKPTKRHFTKRERRLHRNRTRPGRRFRIHPEPGLPFIVEVDITRDHRRMHQSMDFRDGPHFAYSEMGMNTDAAVRSWWAPRQGREAVTRAGLIVARMYLNEKALRERPSEIVAHECTHAAMAWARFRQANLHVMPGEEVLCYAVGRLVKQVNRICFAHRVFET